MKQKQSYNLQQMFEPVRYIQPNFMFYMHYGSVPSKKVYVGINQIKFDVILHQNYEIDIEKKHTNVVFDPVHKYVRERSTWIEIKQGFAIFLNPGLDGPACIELLYESGKHGELAVEIEKLILKCTHKRNKPQKHIHLVIARRNGLDVDRFELPKTNGLLSDHYNEDFNEVNKLILKRLNTMEDKGIILLHGKPGTGKTSYLRYLCHTIKKPIIFITPQIAHELASPNFISFLSDHQNSVLVIEDAENIIMEKNGGRSAVLSNLLNISDGLLSDCLKIQLICTFNCDVHKIDTALMRKGRLICSYEFKPLAVSAALALSNKLGYQKSINKAMTLAEIYNQNEESYTNAERKRIGFEVMEN